MPALSSLPGWFDPGVIAVVALVATRLSALALMTPPLGGAAIPVPVRLAVVVTFSLCLAPLALTAATAHDGRVPSWDLARFVTAMFVEVGLGATMALGVGLAFAAYGVGVRVVDTQVGFAIGQVLDPLTRKQTPVLSALFAQLAMVLFFVTDAADGLVRGLAASVEAFPPGALTWTPQLAVDAVLHQVSGSFSLGFAMVAPVVLALLLVEMALGLMSRSLPQMNMFTMSIPAKTLVGLAALGLWAGGGAAVMRSANRLAFEGWEAMFRHG